MLWYFCYCCWNYFPHTAVCRFVVVFQFAVPIAGSAHKIPSPSFLKKISKLFGLFFRSFLVNFSKNFCKIMQRLDGTYKVLFLSFYTDFMDLQLFTVSLHILSFFTTRHKNNLNISPEN